MLYESLKCHEAYRNTTTKIDSIIEMKPPPLSPECMGQHGSCVFKQKLPADTFQSGLGDLNNTITLPHIPRLKPKKKNIIQ